MIDINTSQPNLETHHRLILASAGSGKTFQLAHRFIQLLFKGAKAENILATTFTRKAAEQILARVLARLAQGVVDRNVRKEIAQILETDELTQQEYKQKITELAKNLHRLSITTIDGFFNSIINCFSLELGIPPQPQMLEAGGAVAMQIQNQAISKMLESEDISKLISWLKQWHSNDSSQSVTEAINDIIRDYYYIFRQAPDKQLWDFEVDVKPLSKDKVAQIIKVLEGMESALPLTKKGTPNSNWKKAWIKICASCKEQLWEQILSETIIKEIINPQKEGKYDGVEISREWLDIYNTIIHHAKAKILDKTKKRHLATYNLISRFSKQYHKILDQNSALLFSDLTYKLASKIDKQDLLLLSDIYFRLDGKIEHLLLDEFQDTSLDQWKVLTPIAKNITGDDTQKGWDKTFFCVGDTKQAVYGWRGGCVELFEQLPKQLQLKDNAITNLDQSYRSSKIILDCVNKVFENINPLEKDADNAAIAHFKKQFKLHTASNTNKDLDGYACLVTSKPEATPVSNDYKKSAGNEEDELVTEHEKYAAKYIKQLNEKYPGATIGVLITKNKTAVKLLHEIRQQGLTASGEGGGALTDSAAVLPVLSALVLADHPEDKACAFHVANSPMGAIVGLTEKNYIAKADLTKEETANNTTSAQKCARKIRSELAQGTFNTVISRWVKQMGASCDEDNLSRLKQLLELAEQFDKQNSKRPIDFVRFVENTKVERLQPAPISVMTIHKAKGLEFDIVILPELDGQLDANKKEKKVLISRSGRDETGEIKKIYPSPKESIRNLDGNLMRQYSMQRSRDRYEDLCTLYVALTRAKQGLYMIVKPQKTKKDGSFSKMRLSFAKLVREALLENRESEKPQQAQILFEIGNKNFKLKNKDETKQEGGIANQKKILIPNIKYSILNNKHIFYPARNPSSFESEGKIKASNILNLRSGQTASKGTIIHDFMQQIGFMDKKDSVPYREDLRQIALLNNPNIDKQTLEVYLKQFDEIVKDKTVINALSQNGATELWRERKFTVTDGKHLLSGRFDRVAITKDSAGNPISALIIDFKTDALPAKVNSDFDLRIKEKKQTYQPQLQAYRRALSKMLNLNKTKIKTSLLFLNPPILVNL